MNKYFIFTLTLIVFIFATPAHGSEEVRTIADLDRLSETSEDRQVDLLFQRAANHYTNSLSSLDDTDVYRSIETLEELIRRYPDSVYVRDAYWAIAELLIKKIQTKEAYAGAVQAYKDYLERFSFYQEAWEAQYNIASIQYLYLKDYDAALESINELFEDYLVALGVSDDRMKRAKILLAKILHKHGEYSKEIESLKEVELLDPAISFGYHAELLKGIRPNRILNQGNDKYIFMGEFDPDYPVSQLVSRFQQDEEKVTIKLPGMTRDFGLDIFVYQDQDYFRSTTDRTGSFASGADAQIFYMSGQPIEPLFAKIYSFLLNNLPSDLKLEFFETGILNAFSNVEINTDTAALELGISEEDFTGEVLFDNSVFALYVSERETIAGAFVNYLLENYPPSNFYRCYRMMEGSRDFSIRLSGPDTAGYFMDIHRVSPETLMNGFEKIYGISFEDAREDFLEQIKNRRAQLDALLVEYRKINPPEKFNLIQDTPENALISYFKAIQLGDFDALRECTTGELKEVLDEARNLYRSRGIMDKIERWKMAIPYMGVNIEVIDRQVLTNSLVVFRVNLHKDGQLMEQQDLVATEHRGKWYISEN